MSQQKPTVKCSVSSRKRLTSWMRWILAVAVLGLCLMLILALLWHPRTSKLGEWCYGHYRGLGLTDDPGLLGKSYFRIEDVLTLPEDGSCSIDCADRKQSCPFVAHYPDGKIRARGRCDLLLDELEQPMGMGRITEGVFFDPTGTCTSRVQNGTGTETFWTFDGTKVWEARLQNSKRLKLTIWHRNGQLHTVYHYKNGRKHGSSDFYTEDGSLKASIIFADGLEVERIDGGSR